MSAQQGVGGGRALDEESMYTVVQKKPCMFELPAYSYPLTQGRQCADHCTAKTELSRNLFLLHAVVRGILDLYSEGNEGRRRELKSAYILYGSNLVNSFFFQTATRDAIC